jgi:hypothetical protein
MLRKGLCIALRRQQRSEAEEQRRVAGGARLEAGPGPEPLRSPGLLSALLGLAFNPAKPLLSRSEAAAASAAERELREELERGMTARYESAMQDVWKRLYDCAAKTHERLADPRNTFRDTLVDNARDLVRVLPSLNITNDPNLIAMAKELDDSLCRHHPETLRQPGVTRAETASKMADLMAKMGAFYTPGA